MKEREFNFYVINLPIRENKKENIPLYEDLIIALFKKRKPVLIAKDKAAIIRTMTSSSGTNKIIYGSMSTFTMIGKDWLNIEKLEKQSFELPKNLFPNLRESYYFFFPKYHRFLLMKSTNGVSLGNVVKYFINARDKKVSSHEYDVHYEVSKDAIKEIMNADFVKTLKISVSYSNADIGSTAFKFVDKELKESNTQTLQIMAKSNREEGIDINKSKMLKGSLDLSKSYGSAEASIVKNNKKRKVKTENYPFLLKLKSNIGDLQKFYNGLFHKLAEYLKDGEQ